MAGIVAFPPRWRGTGSRRTHERRHQPNGDKRRFPAGPFSYLSLRGFRKSRAADIGKAWHMAAVSSQILKASVLAVAATAIGIAILSIGNPVALVANVTASWADKPALQPDADRSTSTIQSIAGTQDLPTTTTDAPTRNEIAAAVEPAEQSQAEIGQPLTEALFKQFQAWAAEDDTRAKVEPAQLVQAASPRVAQHTPAQARPVKTPTCPVSEQCASRDPAPANSSSAGPGRSKCAGTRPPRAGAVRAKLQDTIAPAKLGLALTQRHRDCASLRLPM